MTTGPDFGWNAARLPGALLQFHGPPVAWVQGFNGTSLYLDGTYVVVLRDGVPSEALRFRLSLTAPVPAGSPVNRALRGPPTASRSTGSTPPSRSTRALALEPAGRDGTLQLPPPAGPGYDTITYGSGADAVVFRVWYVRGSIAVQASGQHHIDDDRWHDVIRSLKGAPNASVTGSDGRPIPLGHGTCYAVANNEGAVDELGNPTPPTSSALRRYFGLIEFVGQIDPHDAPGSYRFVRWAETLHFVGPGLAAHTPHADTSRLEHQRVTPDADGKVYDVDGPGHVFSGGQPLGSRQVYESSFTTSLIVGESPDPPNVTPGHVLAQTHWRFHAQYAVMRVPEHAEDAPDIAPVAGYTMVLEETPAGTT